MPTNAPAPGSGYVLRGLNVSETVYSAGDTVEVVHLYADERPGKRGRVLKAYIPPGRKQQTVRILLGVNLSGQRLVKHFPADCVRKVDDQ